MSSSTEIKIIKKWCIGHPLSSDRDVRYTRTNDIGRWFVQKNWRKGAHRIEITSCIKNLLDYWEGRKPSFDYHKDGTISKICHYDRQGFYHKKVNLLLRYTKKKAHLAVRFISLTGIVIVKTVQPSCIITKTQLLFIRLFIIKRVLFIEKMVQP